MLAEPGISAYAVGKRLGVDVKTAAKYASTARVGAGRERDGRSFSRELEAEI